MLEKQSCYEKFVKAIIEKNNFFKTLLKNEAAQALE